MARKIINNLETGLSVRNKLNEMFLELYTKASPIKIEAIDTTITNQNDAFAKKVGDTIGTVTLAENDKFLCTNMTDTSKNLIYQVGQTESVVYSDYPTIDTLKGVLINDKENGETLIGDGIGGVKNITVSDNSIADVLINLVAKSSIVDNDVLNIVDSEDSNKLKSVLFSVLKSTLKTYFDNVYTLVNLSGTPTTRELTINGTTYDLSANRSWTIASGGSIDNYIFVSTSGSNSNSGTLASPYQTLEYAVSQATAGKTIYVMAGSYAPTATLGKNGVNWYFDFNAIVSTSAMSGTYLFDYTSASNDIIIDGHGVFNIVTNGTGRGLFYCNTGVNIKFKHHKIVNTSSLNSFYLNGCLAVKIEGLSHTYSGAGSMYEIWACYYGVEINHQYDYHTGSARQLYIASESYVTLNSTYFQSVAGYNQTTGGSLVVNSEYFSTGGAFLLTNTGTNITINSALYIGNIRIFTSTFVALNGGQYYGGTLDFYGNNEGYSGSGGLVINANCRNIVFNSNIAYAPAVVVVNGNCINCSFSSSQDGKIIFNGNWNHVAALTTYGTIVFNGRFTYAPSLTIGGSSKVTFNNDMQCNNLAGVNEQIALAANSTIEFNSGARLTNGFLSVSGNGAKIVSKGGLILDDANTYSIVTNGNTTNYYGYSELWVKKPVSGTLTEVLASSKSVIVDTNII